MSAMEEPVDAATAAAPIFSTSKLRVLLFFPAVVMTFIVAAYALYAWLRPGRAMKRRPRPAAFNVITSASSLLDTHGNTLTPWTGSRPHAPKLGSSDSSSDPEGWFNLLLVLTGCYVVTAAYYNRLNVGHWMLDHGTFLFGLAESIQDLVRDVAILTAFYGTFTYGFQRIIVAGVPPFGRSRAAQLALQAFAELVFLLASLYYAHGQRQWPLSTRTAFLLQVVVLTAKMHSYLAVNRQLAAEKAGGGPGTGITLFAAPLEQVQVAAAGSSSSAAAASAAAVGAAPAVEAPLPPPSAGLAQSGLLEAEQVATTSDAAPRVTRSRSRSRAPLLYGDSAASPALGSRRRRRASPGPAAAAAAATYPQQQQQQLPALGGGNGLAPAGAAGADDAEGSAASSSSPISDRLQRWSSALTDELRVEAGADPASLRTLAAGAVDSSGGGGAGTLASGLAAVVAGGRPVAGSSGGGRGGAAVLAAYPDNVTLKDFLLFSFAPTMCYEPNYPRTQSIRVGYVLEKLFLALGLMAAGMNIITQSINPVFRQLPQLEPLDAVSRLLLPITLVFLLLFFVTFECILNAFAELTFFAARDFYSAFWNSTTFLEFSRHWNKPVHNFLLRHCYVDAMRQGFSPNAALYFTFLVSIVVHELLLWGAFGLTLPYLSLFSLLQLPLAKLMQLGIFKGRRLGNLLFWFGLTFGITLVAVLYAYEYCVGRPGACGDASPP